MSLVRPCSCQPRARPARASGPSRRAGPWAGRVGEPAGQRLVVLLGQRHRVDEAAAAVRRGRGPAPVSVPVPRPQLAARGQPGPAVAGRVPGQPAGHLARARARSGRCRSPRPVAGPAAPAADPGDPVRQRGVQPVPQHPELQGVEELVDLLPVPRHRAAGRAGPASSCTSRASSVSCRLRSTSPRCSRSLSPALPLTSSTRSTSAASEPYSDHPPGRRSSPRRRGCSAGCRSGRRAARRSPGTGPGSARTSPCTAAGREPGHVADPAAGHQHGHVVGDQLERVPVTGHDQHVMPSAAAWVASVAMMSSAS